FGYSLLNDTQFRADENLLQRYGRLQVRIVEFVGGDAFCRVSLIFVVQMFVPLPLFRDLKIPSSAPVDRKDGEQGHGHPKNRCRGNDWQPVCPDSLTLP